MEQYRNDMKTAISQIARGACKPLTGFLVCAICLSFPGSPARSVELSPLPADINTATISSPLAESSHPAMADSCLSLLKTVRHTSPVSAMDRTRHSAGQATALGLVIGVRFALGPKEITKKSRNPNARKPRVDIWKPDTGSAQALAVSAYRQCKNQNTLQAISDWRWSR